MPRSGVPVLGTAHEFCKQTVKNYKVNLEGERGNNLLYKRLLSFLLENKNLANLMNVDQSGKPPAANQFILIHLFEQVVSLCELLEQFR